MQAKTAPKLAAQKLEVGNKYGDSPHPDFLSHPEKWFSGLVKTPTVSR